MQWAIFCRLVCSVCITFMPTKINTKCSYHLLIKITWVCQYAAILLFVAQTAIVLKFISKHYSRTVSYTEGEVNFLHSCVFSLSSHCYMKRVFKEDRRLESLLKYKITIRICIQRFPWSSNCPKSQHSLNLSVPKEHSDELEAIRSNFLWKNSRNQEFLVLQSCFGEYTFSRVQNFTSAIDFCASQMLQQLFYSAVLTFSSTSLLNYFQKTSHCNYWGWNFTSMLTL